MGTNRISSYEETILKILKLNNLDFVREKNFKDLRGGLYRFDFFVKGREPYLIEVDGEYHFHPIRGRAKFLHQKENDRRKNSYALAHNIPLYRIPYWEIKNIKSIEDIKCKRFLVTSKWHNDNLSDEFFKD